MGNGLKILSCGAGMQSTAAALMSCENKAAAILCKPIPFPLIPVYDYIIFCDLGEEPPWVYSQVKFIADACEDHGIEFVILDTHLYDDYMSNFGKRRVVSIPFWTLEEVVQDQVQLSLDDDCNVSSAKTIKHVKGKLPRNCTLDYKIAAIQKHIRWNILGYKKGERTKAHDEKAHEMHIGFSLEEKQRAKPNPHRMFTNHFPLIDMGLERKDNYAYILDVWGLDTKASACNICPFHRNYFFDHLKNNYKEEYDKVVEFDELLETEQPNTKIKSKMYISRSRKRIKDLTCEDCKDAEYFKYKGQDIWNGF